VLPEPVAFALEWTFDGEERGIRLYDDERHCRLDAESDGGVCSPLYTEQQVRALLAQAATTGVAAPASLGPALYSIDADPEGIRARVADAITGALAFGAQNSGKPPAGHWLAPFWTQARFGVIQFNALRDSAYALLNAPAVEQGEVLVTVSGFTGSGKSAIAGEIEILCRALGLQVQWPDGDSEKNMTHADWTAALEQYKPCVRIVEQNIPFASKKGLSK